MIITNAQKNAHWREELEDQYKKVDKNLNKIEKGIKNLEKCYQGKRFKEVYEIINEPVTKFDMYSVIENSNKKDKMNFSQIQTT